ncbi:MAG: heme o synthase [Phycisphaeraceae bacterium]
MTDFPTHKHSAIPLGRVRERTALSARLSDHVGLTKPGITVMVIVTALAGYAMGAAWAGWDWLTLPAALAGTGLSCMGASALNQLWERDTDAKMQRTRERPLPAGRLSARESLAVALVYAILGVGVLWQWAHPLAAVLSALTIVLYVLVYTPMKRVSSLSTTVGAVPGAMPPLIGYAAATGQVGIEAVLLFAVMFVWQLPHFYAIGWLYRDDYARAKLPILPVVDPTGRRTFRHILVSSVVLLAAGAMPTLLGVGGLATLIVAGLCGGAFLLLAVRVARVPSRGRARALFLASLVYLPVVMTVVVLDQKVPH